MNLDLKCFKRNLVNVALVKKREFTRSEMFPFDVPSDCERDTGVRRIIKVES